jgi:hypothetical protein
MAAAFAANRGNDLKEIAAAEIPSTKHQIPNKFKAPITK